MISVRKTWIKIYDRQLKEAIESNYSSKHP